MSNKKYKSIQVSLNEDLQTICQQAFKNKIDLEEFYTKNRMKFPPILQSRHMVLNHLSVIKPKQNPDKIIELEKTLAQQQSAQCNQQRQLLRKKWIQSRPNVCKIIFEKDSSRKYRRNSLIAYPEQIKKQRSLNMQHSFSRQKYNYFDDRNRHLKFLNEPTSHQIDISTLAEHLNFTQVKGRQTFRPHISQSLEATHKDQQNQNLAQQLLVNRVSTINPEDQLLKTLRKSRNNLLEENTHSIKKRSSVDKNIDVSRITFYQHADGILQPRRRNNSNFKGIGMFQPWQLTNLLEQDLLPEQSSLKQGRNK